jgi:hypothetical protein
MKARKLILLTGTVLFVVSLANAQASRTWVSGVGDDANPCSRTAPCKTFAGAISKTAAGGEIDALDPAGYGAVTITKAITIDGGGGQVASVLVSGTNGIVVQAGTNDVVTLRNIQINGIGTGINGIRFLAGKALHVENCTISGFTTRGIDIATSGGGQVEVLNTIVRDNNDSGIKSLNTANTVSVSIDHSKFINNRQFGVFASDFSKFSIRNTTSASNGNIGFLAQAANGTAVINLVDSIASNNSIGVQAGGNTAPTTIRIGRMSLLGNPTGIVVGINGSVLSFGSNFNDGTGAPSGDISTQ